MVAVVSGTGLGLFTTTRAGGDPQLGRGNENVFVNTTNGNLIVQSLDENVAALGLDLALVRTYNSQGLTDDDNNDGWRLGTRQRVYSLSGTLNGANSTIKKVFGDGSEVTYAYDQTLLAYVSTDGDGAHDTLTWNGTIWTWQDGSSRVRETYDWSGGVGRIQTSVDANNNTVNYFYTGTLLTRVRMAGAAPVVQDVWFDYYASTNDVEKIRVESTDAQGLKTQVLTRYYYDASHRLVTVRTDMDLTDQAMDNTKAYVTSYTYDTVSGCLASITQTANTSSNVISKVSFTYMQVGGSWRVRTVTDGEGRVATYNYSSVVNPGGNTVQPVATPGWSVPELISAEGESIGSIAKIAFDASGNAFALWNSDWITSSEARDIVVRRFDRATNTWGARTVLDTGTTSAQGSRSYQIAMDENGNAIVAWSQSNGAGTYSVYASRYQVVSGTWDSTPTLLESLSTNVDYHPTTSLAVAIASGSAAAVSWIQSDGTYNTTYVARWNGTTWSAATAIESAINNTRQTTLAIDGAGNVIAAWVQPNASSVDTVYANRFDAVAAAWSGPQALSAAGAASSRPQVAMDFAGNAFAVWLEGSTANLVGRRYDKASNTWQAAQTLDTGANAAMAPSLAMDRQSGAGFVAWVQNDGVADSLFARRFTGTGSTLNGTVDVIETGSEMVISAAQQDTGNLATAMRGAQAVVMWNQVQTIAGTNYANAVMAARFNGASWQAPEYLSNAVGLGGGFFSNVAIDAQGNVSAIYGQYYGDSGTYVARYNAPASWSGPIAISNSANQSLFAKLATDANGNVFDFWIQTAPDYLSANAMARRFDKATNTWGPAVVLSTLGTANALGETAISVDEYGNAIAVWQADYGSGRALYANRYNLATGSWGGQELIQGPTQPVDILRPGGFAVQMSGGNAVIAWLQRIAANNYQVWAARYSAGSLVAPFRLDTGTGIGNAYSVSATIDKAGNIGVAWQQADTALGFDRIYSRRFTQSAGTWSSQAALSGSTTAATAPQIGYDADGNGIAIWCQAGDVYFQRYDKTTGWVGSPAAIDNLAGATESTTLSVDRQGKAVAAWIQADAGGIKSLYASIYTPGTGWSPVALLESSNLVVRTNPGTAAVVVSAAMHGNFAAVSWLQKTPAGNQSDLVSTEAWVNRWNGSTWLGAEMVNQSPGMQAFDPSVAVDMQGNTTVSYSNYSDLSRTYVNQYRVNTAWSGEAALFPTNESPGTVRSAFDSAGNGFAAWTGNVAGVTKLYVSRYDKASNLWQTPAVVDSSTTGVTWWLPTISVDEGGNAVLAWSRHDGTTYNMYASRYSARTGAWSAAVAIETSSQPVTAGATQKVANLASAISAENNLAVAWLQSNGSADDVYVARWNGLTWTTTQVDSQTASATNVGVAIDLDGNVTAIWLQSDGTAASVYQNRYTATSATTGSWGTASQLDIVGTPVSRPMIAFDAYGNAIAAWIQGTDLYARRYDKATNTWLAAAPVSGGTNPPEYPALAVDAAGNAVLGWIRNDGTANSVYASILKAGSSSWTAAALLENSNLGAPTTDYNSGFNVAVAIRAGLAVVGWNQQNWGSSITSANLFQARWNGTTWSAAEQVDNTTEINGGYYNSVGIDAQGNTFSLFPHWRGSDNRTYYNRYTAPNSYTQTTVSDGLGRVTVYKHDSLNRLISVTTPASGGVREETRYQYDRDGNVNAIIQNANGVARTTVMVYDARGNCVLTRTPDGTTTRRTYDANNQLTIETVYSVPDIAGRTPQAPMTTRYYYDTTAPWLGIMWPPSAAALPCTMGLPARSASSPLARPKATDAMALPWEP